MLNTTIPKITKITGSGFIFFPESQAKNQKNRN